MIGKRAANTATSSGCVCVPLTCVSWARDPCVVSSAAGRGSRCRWGQRAADQSADNSLCQGAHRETCNTQTHTDAWKECSDEQTDAREGRFTLTALAGFSSAKLTTTLLPWHPFLEVWRTFGSLNYGWGNKGQKQQSQRLRPTPQQLSHCRRSLIKKKSRK